MTHPALTSDSVAVITGGAAGIGLGAAKKFAGMGMTVVLVDNREALLEAAADAVAAAGAHAVMTRALDVTDRSALVALDAEIAEQFGGTDILMNNAGIQPGSTMLVPVASMTIAGPRTVWPGCILSRSNTSDTRRRTPLSP